MITLTTPEQINSVLGGSVPVSYDKLVISPINFNPISQSISANMVLTSTSKPSMPSIQGNLSISLVGGAYTVQVPNIVTQNGTLTAGQITTVQGWVDSSQANIENGLVSLGLVVGTRTAGV